MNYQASLLSLIRNTAIAICIVSLSGCNQSPSKVADSTTSPASTPGENNAVQESQAKQNISVMNKAQQAYFFERGSFADNFDSLALGTLAGAVRDAERENYSYQIAVVETNKTMTAAKPKTDGLKSYVGIVYRYNNAQGEAILGSVMCESNEPTKTPATPQLEANPTAPPTCSSGYSEVKL